MFFLFVAVATAHVALFFTDNKMPIRNAKDAVSNGTFSTDTDGCGGPNKPFAINGLTKIVVNTPITMMFDYGTGTNGDHADPNNKFYVSLVNLDMGLKQSDMFNMSYVIAGPIPAANGSTLSHYTVTVTPSVLCRRCILSVWDQRKWGGCYDLKIVSMEEFNGAPMMFNGWVPADELQGLTEANCVAPYYSWTTKNYSALDSGFKGAPQHCCPVDSVDCGMRCWQGAAPKKDKNDALVFADGSICLEETLCNIGGSVEKESLCGYKLNKNVGRKCTSSCRTCMSLCETSSQYTECWCVGRSVAGQTAILSLLAIFISLMSIVM